MSQFTTGTDLPTIPCCLCGIMIKSNAANQCAQCLSQQFDLTSTLNAGGELCVNRCKRCLRYESAGRNGRYEELEPESKELLALCMRNIPAFNSHGNGNLTEGATNIKLVDANFVWTEPHNKRLKLKLTVRADVMHSTISIQQRCMVELKEKNKQCVECQKVSIPRTCPRNPTPGPSPNISNPPPILFSRSLTSNGWPSSNSGRSERTATRKASC